ncbi:MAG: hypothetical protein ACLGHQ_07825 [Acidimicrobiia bacterium]
MTVHLRVAERPPDDAVVLIHMGAGIPVSTARSALRGYSDYVGIRGEGSGLFTISVFAATAGVSEDDITGAFDHNQFGRSTVGSLRAAGLELIATTIVDPDMPPAIQTIQRVHFDIVLGVAYEGRAIPNVDAEVAELIEVVAAAALPVLELFLPRVRKPPAAHPGRGKLGEQ